MYFEILLKEENDKKTQIIYFYKIFGGKQQGKLRQNYCLTISFIILHKLHTFLGRITLF